MSLRYEAVRRAIHRSFRPTYDTISKFAFPLPKKERQSESFSELYFQNHSPKKNTTKHEALTANQYILFQSTVSPNFRYTFAPSSKNRNSASRRLKKTDMFAVRGGPCLLILLAILAPVSFATSINYEDLQPAATFHFHRHEERGGNDRYAIHRGKASDHADTGYKRYHEADKVTRGHDNLDKGYGYYDDDGKRKTYHHHDDDRYDKHHVGRESEKGEKLVDNGHYDNGHSTHGRHEVKELDEYQNHNELYDEEHDSDFDEEDGGYRYGHEEEKGGDYKDDRHDYDEHEADHYGKRDYYEQGHDCRDHKGYSDDQDHQDYYYNDYLDGKKDSSDRGWKWIHKIEY